MGVIVVGAGMAGLACARGLLNAGHEVTLIDKGRGPGGRMSARRVAVGSDEVVFDHGAPFFTAGDPAFLTQVLQWQAAGEVAPWPSAGEGAWVGTPAMNNPLKAMAADLDVRWGTRVERLVQAPEGWSIVTDTGGQLEADSVVVAVPAEQASVLLEPVNADFAALARSAGSLPCWTLMQAFSVPLPSPQDCVRGHDDSPLGWAIRNSAKPGRASLEAWVVHAGSAWSARNLHLPPDQVEAAMAAALFETIGVTPQVPMARAAHRWRYARSVSHGSGTLWDPVLMLGVCGDWLLGETVENAWLAGTDLARKIAAPANFPAAER